MIGSLEALYISNRLDGYAYYLYALLLSCVPRWFQYSILSMYKHVLTGILILLAVKAWEVLFPGRGVLAKPTRDIRWQT